VSYPTTTWFDRAFARLSLPGWAGMLLCLIPFAGLYIIGSVLGLGSSQISLGSAVTKTVSSLVFIEIIAFPLPLGSMLLTRYMNGRVGRLKEYANTLSRHPSSLQLESQYRLSGILLAWAPFLVVLTPIFYAFSGSSFLFWLFTLPAWYYLMLFPATFLWTFCYAMFATSKMGKQPLELKPFTEDKTLGLRMFGTESLRLTGIYLLFVSLVIGGILFTSPIPFQIAVAVLLAFSLAGIALFLLPLLSLHHKLVQVKREKESWIGRKYTSLVAQLERNTESTREEKMLLASDLSAIDKVQRDINQIRTWPFDVGIIVRLVTIILLPVIISVVGQYVLLALKL
jgi:hypothetical protein